MHLLPPKNFQHLIPDEIQCENDEVWRCVKPVYGLNNAPRLWYESAAASFLWKESCKIRMGSVFIYETR